MNESRELSVGLGREEKKKGGTREEARDWRQARKEVKCPFLG